MDALKEKLQQALAEAAQHKAAALAAASTPPPKPVEPGVPQAQHDELQGERDRLAARLAEREGC